MKLKKPKFWDYPRPNLIAYLLLPFSILLQIFKSFQKKEGRNFKIKTICGDGKERNKKPSPQMKWLLHLRILHPKNHPLH